MRWVVALLFVSLGCRGQSSSAGDMWFAGLATGLAAVTLLPNLVRNERDLSCPETCPPEYACNRSTGLCDRAACGNHCSGSQVCSVAGALETCLEMRPATPHLNLDIPLLPTSLTLTY